MKVKFLFALLLGWLSVSGQNINGKWYGKLTQEPGGYRRVYSFELDIVQDNDLHKDSISGTSYAYIDYQIEARIGFTGSIRGDTITLRENEYQIQEETAPTGWVICIKNLRLAHLRVDNKEFLRGRWTGIANGQDKPCVPGLLILARNPRDLKPFIEKNGYQPSDKPRAIVENTALNSSAEGSPEGKPGEESGTGKGLDSNTALGEEFTGPGGVFENTVVSKLSEITVSQKELQLYLLDYSKVDKDSISVYLNRQPILQKVAITEKPVKINLTLNENLPRNELLFFAESLGEVPPNTAGIALKDGDQWHKIKIQSDHQKSSAIYISIKKEIKSPE
ncbi:MAG TPA: hypothetical protein VGD90_06610 [Sphingobacteriaceae bacterium]